MSLPFRIAAPFGKTVPDALVTDHNAGSLPYWQCEASIWPLVTFRVLFGLVAAFGAARFLYEGWVDRLILSTPLHFDFYGFAWLPRPDVPAAYALYGVVLLSALCVSLGYRFRLAAPLFVVSFAYTELLDATHYLNHYYLVVLLGGLLAVTPAHAAVSLDVRGGRVIRRERVPAWCLHAIQLQLAFVYFFAGVAKVNADWLLRAMPMAIWLPEHADWPFVGGLLTKSWVAYAASWAGCLYDLTIVGFLLHPRTRRYAYGVVLCFHGATWALFNIGLFPLIMSTATLVFFPGVAHERFWRKLKGLLWTRWTGRTASNGIDQQRGSSVSGLRADYFAGARFLLLPYFLLQLALPLRALAYPGPTAWTEEGYRFGWRVMLVEKAGTATFTVRDERTGRQVEVKNRDHLSDYQIKQMAIQPDFILQFAHHLADYYAERGFASPEVYCESHVALNGRRSRPLIDPSVNLAAEVDGLSPKAWILAPQ